MAGDALAPLRAAREIQTLLELHRSVRYRRISHVSRHVYKSLD